MAARDEEENVVIETTKALWTYSCTKHPFALGAKLNCDSYNIIKLVVGIPSLMYLDEAKAPFYRKQITS